MSNFVLVHGAWHGGWCWRYLTPLLQQAGHKVATFDLPGLGGDPTVPGEVTLTAYAQAVVNVVREQGAPVILLGHSLGGLAITQAAEVVPERIAALIYLSAYLPANGETVQHWAQQSHGGLSVADLVMSSDGLSATVRDEAIVDAFYPEVSPERAAWAKSLLRPQAVAPWSAPVSTTRERFGSVARHYIECIKDHAITIEIQRAMTTALPCQSVEQLDTDHSPFLSATGELAEALERIAERVARSAARDPAL